MTAKVQDHTVVDESPTQVSRKSADLVDTLMHIEASIDVMKDTTDAAFTRNKNRLAFKRIGVDPFDSGGANEERVFSIFAL